MLQYTFFFLFANSFQQIIFNDVFLYLVTMQNKHYWDTERNGKSKADIPTSKRIIRFVTEVQEMLISKNTNYGDSATKPANIFAKGKASENLCARIDDKLMRIKNSGINHHTIDTIKDLIGYLILLLIAIEDEE